VQRRALAKDVCRVLFAGSILEVAVQKTIAVHIVNRKEPHPIENQVTRMALYQSLGAMQVGYIQPLHRCRERTVDQSQRQSAFGHWAVRKKNNRSHDKLALYLPMGVSQSRVEFQYFSG
jgi:hypothetical protein